MSMSYIGNGIELKYQLIAHWASKDMVSMFITLVIHDSSGKVSVYGSDEQFDNGGHIVSTLRRP